MNSQEQDQCDLLDYASNKSRRMPSKSKTYYQLISVAIFFIVLLALAAASTFFDYLIAAAGPGQSDHTKFSPITGGFVLYDGGRGRRSIFKQRSGISVRWDVRKLGWNDRFIVCHRYGPTDDGTSQFPSGPPAWEWWIIDVTQMRLLGPLDDSEYAASRHALGIAPDFVVHDLGRSLPP